MNKVQLKEYIQSDLFRYFGMKTRKTFFENMLINPGFKYMFYFRITQYYKDKNKILYYLYKLFLRKYKYKFGYEIPIEVKIDKGLYINHLGGIAINPKAVIGKNVNITKGVTIGQTNRGKNKGVPVIGDCVWIGANATIVGNVKIGNNVLIAPNSYVNIDIPNNSVVVGNPCKIVPKENATESYINNCVN